VNSKEGICLLDGGASDTMTPRKDLLRDYVPIKGEVTVGDGTSLKIEGKGKLLLHISKECVEASTLISLMFYMFQSYKIISFPKAHSIRKV